MTATLVLPENASPKWRLAFGFLEDRWNTKRRVVDAKAVAMAIMPHWNGGKSHHILAGPLTATLNDYGSFSVDRVSGPASHADIVELCKMLGEFGRR